jgi:hypothetical protein
MSKEPPAKFNTSKLVLHHSTFFLGFEYIYLFYFVEEGKDKAAQRCQETS